jgi:deazaflavin-dependent oxidoreductase (nitroreductase family)
VTARPVAVPARRSWYHAGQQAALSRANHRQEDWMLFGQEHVDRYRATDGREGYEWQGTKILLLTTTGRRSGENRDSALIYGRYGDAYLVVASKGGADQAPAWYLNLRENPEVEVQVKEQRFPARARTATPSERAALWGTMTAAWPAYDQYQTRTSREIPIVVLDPLEPVS